MLAALAIGLSLSAPVAVAEEPLFDIHGFRIQSIRRMSGEDEWPFVAQSGKLLCTYILKQPKVYFVPDGVDLTRAFHISQDIMGMAMVNIGMTDILLKTDNFEQLLIRISPYVAMGNRLCKQPAGAVLPESEL